MKKIMSIVFAALLVFTFNACDQKNPAKDGNTTETSAKNTSVEKNVDKKKADYKEINKGDLVKIDDYCEFKIINTKFAKKIVPPKPEGMHTYYEAEEAGTTYFDTTINIKSLLTSGKSADEFLSVKVIYDGKYEYNTFSTIEENGGSNFTYTNITSIEPLKNGILHFLAEVPEGVEKDNKTLEVIITANKQQFKLKIK
ncbi:hypothetical protein phiCT453A_45 (endogenous virus) [Clostridium phage phiCT453A]|uniref:lipoprotein n=1 Tax=Clostridium phage phiCT453A TaxID=1567012 RepID=UPI0005140D65|nr:phage lipoprotein [Clostridium tetani]YP_009216689.1 lipoprotein [Clostridium phage phiCT453A]AJA42535.1 hypothetical protein phiCT453A_45 [Clostridium phage phiCT453A]KGI42514.1 phage lipoprotein [Clostridium tetani]RXM58109.1 hypothetical protein DP133_07940 [Clostridium tetani]